MSSTQANTQFDNALGILAQQTFESDRSLFREAVKAHPENYTTEITSALEAPAFEYDTRGEYDGGDFIADVNVDFYDRGTYVGRITCTVIPTLGSGKFPLIGKALLQYDIREINGWRVYCKVSSEAGMVVVSWRGMGGEYIGNSGSYPIQPRGDTYGSGKVM